MTTVLLVEDNHTLLESISFELEMRGYDVIQACDGLGALALLEETPTEPDIIVSDIAMPDMDGYELLEAVRKHECWEGLPFIFLTAFDSSSAVRLGKELGVDDYLTKPFEPEDLITAMESKIKRFEQLDKRAERKLDASRERLLRLLSHELRTPLATIYGSTQVLERTLADISDDDTQKMIHILDSGAQRMNRLINRVLLFAQMDTDGNTQTLYDRYSTTVDVRDCITEAVANYKEDYPDLTHPIEIDASPSLPSVKALKDFIKSMVDELLDNAVKFSTPDQLIRIVATHDADWVTVSVTDQGCGIESQYMESIWERFTQINREFYEQQGLGIGLTMVKRSAQLHSGFCDIVSQPQQGTTASFSLPIHNH
jgi:two-component system sensor histidine kinase/response regulator